MYIEPFKSEQFYAQYEFNTPHLLSVSDCETITIKNLLELAGASPIELENLALGYTESQGNPKLRAAIAAIYENATPEDVVVLTSPVEGIYLAMRTLLEPQDEAVVLVPAYDSLKNMANHICAKTRLWSLKPDKKRWAMDLNELKSLVNANTKMIVVNFPHNPTGFLPSQTDFSQLVEIAKRHNLWLFCDEMYRGLELTAAPLPSATDVYEKSVVLCGLSKAHGLPGLRSGWLVIKDKPLREKLMNWKHYTTICPPAPSERLALCALKASDQIIGTNRMLVKQNLQFAAPFFKRWQQWFEWRPPQAGSTAFVKVNVASAAKYCHHLAQTAGVLLLPGSCMWDNDQFVRFGFGRKSFQAALAAYDRFLETNGLNQNA